MKKKIYIITRSLFKKINKNIRKNKNINRIDFRYNLVTTILIKLIIIRI